MIRSYCTLFDKNYLYQGVALYRSLLRHAGNFRLYALCMDATAYELMRKLSGETLTPILVDELITDEIAAVRQRTTHGQFCWVCQPLVCQFVLDRFGVDMITYLESDSLFFSSPEPLFDELGPRSVSLVPHNYAQFDNSDTAGEFCVQFNAFRNDVAAREVLAHWRQACFKYDRSAPHLYPGQTTLDEWPHRFAGIAVIQHRGAGVAPWNVSGYRLDVRQDVPTVNDVPVVFYHYHQYGRFRNGSHELGSYPLSAAAVDLFYRPYVAAMRAAEAAVQALDPQFRYRREYDNTTTLLDLLRSVSRQRAVAYLQVLKRKLRGRYNVVSDDFFPGGTAGHSPS